MSIENRDCHSETLLKICARYGLGKPESEPAPLKGGFLHKMYSLFTDKGKYAVKLLNPFIMQRETAAANYRTAEELEAILEQNDIPIIPALKFVEKKMQEIDGQFFYLYEWYGGKALDDRSATEYHCSEIGSVLARIHTIDWREEPTVHNEININWEKFLDPLSEKNRELYFLLGENIPMLYEMQEKGNSALKRLSPATAICHNDMDCKNVLWLGRDLRIIDLECLSRSDPFMELFETSLCWSGLYDRNFDPKRFETFIRSYAEAGGRLPPDVETLYDANVGRLEWLEYSIKRALGIECSGEEQAVGVSEARNTIAVINYYRGVKESIIYSLKSFNKNYYTERNQVQ